MKEEGILILVTSRSVASDCIKRHVETRYTIAPLTNAMIPQPPKLRVHISAGNCLYRPMWHKGKRLHCQRCHIKALIIPLPAVWNATSLRWNSVADLFPVTHWLVSGAAEQVSGNCCVTMFIARVSNKVERTRNILWMKDRSIGLTQMLRIQNEHYTQYWATQLFCHKHNFMQHSPSWETDRSSASQGIRRIHNSLPPVRILSQINLVHAPFIPFSKIHFNFNVWYSVHFMYVVISQQMH